MQKIRRKMNILKKLVKEDFIIGREDRLFYMDSFLEKHLLYNSDIYDDNIEMNERSEALVKKFNSLSREFMKLTDEYLEAVEGYIPVREEEISGSKTQIDRIEARNIKDRANKSFCNICRMLRKIILDIGLVDNLAIREKRALNELGIGEIITPEWIEEYKKDLLSERSLKVGNEIKNMTKALFWANKLSKIVKQSMIGYLMEKENDRTSNLKYEKMPLEVSKELKNKNKRISLGRYDIIHEIIEYYENNIERKKCDLDFINFLGFYIANSKLNVTQETIDYYKSEKMKNKLSKIPAEYFEIFTEVLSEYNKLFDSQKDINGETFLYDCFVIGTMRNFQRTIYAIKSDLTAMLMYNLISVNVHKVSSPYVNYFGFGKDSTVKENENYSSILYTFLPNCMKPVMVHMDDSIKSIIDSIEDTVPKYNGIFNTKKGEELPKCLANNLLVELNDEQKKQIKNRIKKLTQLYRNRKKEISKISDEKEKRMQEIVLKRDLDNLEILKKLYDISKGKDMERD